MKTARQVHRKGGKQGDFPQAQRQPATQPRPGPEACPSEGPITLCLINGAADDLGGVELSPPEWALLQSAARAQGRRVDDLLIEGLDRMLAGLAQPAAPERATVRLSALGDALRRLEDVTFRICALMKLLGDAAAKDFEENWPTAHGATVACGVSNLAYQTAEELRVVEDELTAAYRKEVHTMHPLSRVCKAAKQPAGERRAA